MYNIVFPTFSRGAHTTCATSSASIH